MRTETKLHRIGDIPVATRSLRQNPLPKRSMTGLLLAIGFTEDELRVGSKYWNAGQPRPRNRSRTVETFQRREADNMQEWYERAKARWRQRIKQVHPDTGGSEEEAARLNLAWARLRIVFARRGVAMKP